MSVLDRGEVEISVDAWVIQDGNYDDFHIGEKIRCAFEFYGELNPTTQCALSMTRLHQDTYRVCAQVLFVGADVWVIDFGFAAFLECYPPEFVRIGVWLEGEIQLGIDPFMYRDHLRDEPGMPNIFNTWQITAISRDDTPWLTLDGNNFSRDQNNVRWTEVQETDAWNDDNGSSAYLLRLSVMSPKLEGSTDSIS